MYLNAEYARAHGHPDVVVNPMLVLCTVVGLSVEDLSESGGRVPRRRGLHVPSPRPPGRHVTARSTVVRDTPVAEPPGSASSPGTPRATTRRASSSSTTSARTSSPRRGRDRPSTVRAGAATVLRGLHRRPADAPRAGATVGDVENNLVTKQVMNTAQGHWNDHAMGGSPMGDGRLVFGLVTASLVFGLASQDTAEHALAELGVQGSAVQRAGAPRRHAVRLHGGARMPALRRTRRRRRRPVQALGPARRRPRGVRRQRTVLLKRRSHWPAVP